jgi:hypothetical protein
MSERVHRVAEELAEATLCLYGAWRADGMSGYLHGTGGDD